MLAITVLGEEQFDEEKQEFVYPDAIEIELEHSLVSLSKWEAIFEKPFIVSEKKTNEETLTYINVMITTPDVPLDIVNRLSEENIDQINRYIEAKMTATWFSNEPGRARTGEVITAELIYYWMISFNIPFECQHWHLNKLLTLIKVANAKNSKPKKMSQAEINERNRRINAERKARLGTTG